LDQPVGPFDRFHEEVGQDNREAAQRDRDRILYTSAFQRLAEVTQVLSPDEGHVFHNRLTHSLKVAQVARRLAELLKQSKGALSQGLNVDPDVAETAALSHDLGHPPFGHIAEEELDSFLVEDAKAPGGFDGNAQSFRIVNRLALRCGEYVGLNLTRATCNGILKYPWERAIDGKRHKKWGAYTQELDQFKWARRLSSGDERSAEAEIMDWADDVTYAVHDVNDFYRAGLIPLDRLAVTARERQSFYDDVFQRGDYPPYSRPELEEAFEKFCSFLPFTEPYAGTNRHRSELRSLSAGMISMYVRGGLEIPNNQSGDRVLRVNPEHEKAVIMLKELTWHYVILRPSLATQQHGQRLVIQTLCSIFMDAALTKKRRVLFPFAFQDLLEQAGNNTPALARIVCDYIAGMTEKQAVALHLKLTGVSPGSGLR
jgi:dGTPase